MLLVHHMPVPFPHQYSATISRSLASRPRGEVPSPQATPQGERADDVTSWSPEHLVLSSLGIGLLTTLEAFAARDGIELRGWTANARGTVDRTPEGLMFTSIILGIDLEIDGDPERVERILVEHTLEDAKQYCLVLNSLRVPVIVEAQIQRGENAAAERHTS